MAARPRVGFLLGVFVAGIVLFIVPSAWLYARGVPWVLCALGGALAFPLLPVGWHLWAERKSAKAAAVPTKGPAKPKTSALTGGDRFTMRLVVVAVAALGPLFFFRFGQTLRAVRDHGAWFIPKAPPAPRTFKGDQRLLDQVPSDAEFVVWLRNLDGLQGDDDKDAKKKEPEAEEVLMAYRDGEVLIVARGPEAAFKKVDVDEINAQLPKAPAWLPIHGKFEARQRAGDLMVLVTDGWAQAADDRATGKSTGPTAIIERLKGAPADAVVISAASPSRPIAGFNVNGAQWWVRVSKTEIRLDGEVFVSDKAAAQSVADGTRAGFKMLGDMVPGDCKAPVAKLISRFVVDNGETSVRVSARWKPDEIGEAVMCGFAAAMKNADWKETK